MVVVPWAGTVSENGARGGNKRVSERGESSVEILLGGLLAVCKQVSMQDLMPLKYPESHQTKLDQIAGKQLGHILHRQLRAIRNIINMDIQKRAANQLLC